MAQCKLQEIAIIMRDLNAEVGKKWDEEMVVKLRLGTHNKIKHRQKKKKKNCSKHRRKLQPFQQEAVKESKK